MHMVCLFLRLDSGYRRDMMVVIMGIRDLRIGWTVDNSSSSYGLCISVHAVGGQSGCAWLLLARGLGMHGEQNLEWSPVVRLSLIQPQIEGDRSPLECRIPQCQARSTLGSFNQPRTL